MGEKSGEHTRDYSRIARRITVTLSATRGLVSAAFIVSGTVSMIVAAQLSGSPAWAGVASSVKQVGTAFAALAVAATSDRIGRRWGLALGLAVGAVGAGFAVASILAGALPLFLVGALFLGVASAAMRLGRFAAAEVQLPSGRGQAISGVVAGGAAGSILGPLLTGPSDRVAQRAGLAGLAGPYIATVVLLALASLAILLWLRPDPRDVGREIAERHPEVVVRQGLARPVSQILRTPAALVALAAMLTGQVAMAMLTGIASLQMANGGHSLPDISIVAAAHTFGMFVFSIPAGRLTDRWGRGPVILSGTILLALSCAIAPISSDVVPLAIALFLLGVGWNLSYVGGSALLSDQLSPDERAKTQGTNDLVIGLGTALASLGSGLVFAGTGYTGIGIMGALVSLAPVGLTGWWMVRSRRAAGEVPAEGCPAVAGADRAGGGLAIPAACLL